MRSHESSSEPGMRFLSSCGSECFFFGIDYFSISCSRPTSQDNILLSWPTSDIKTRCTPPPSLLRCFHIINRRLNPSLNAACSQKTGLRAYARARQQCRGPDAPILALSHRLSKATSIKHQILNVIYFLPYRRLCPRTASSMTGCKDGSPGTAARFTLDAYYELHQP